jgi:hypothetical protein
MDKFEGLLKESICNGGLSSQQISDIMMFRHFGNKKGHLLSKTPQRFNTAAIMRSIWRRKFWVEFNLHPKQIFFAEGEKTLLTRKLAYR